MKEAPVVNENLKKTLQLAFATVAATLVHQQMKIANLENILIGQGIAQQTDLTVAELRQEVGIDELMNLHFPELSHLPDLFENM